MHKLICTCLIQISANRVPKGYLITNDKEQLIDFNHRVLVQMVHILHDAKKETEKVLDILSLINDSISSLHEFLQMLFEEKNSSEKNERPIG